MPSRGTRPIRAFSDRRLQEGKTTKAPWPRIAPAEGDVWRSWIFTSPRFKKSLLQIGNRKRADGAASATPRTLLPHATSGVAPTVLTRPGGTGPAISRILHTPGPPVWHGAHHAFCTPKAHESGIMPTHKTLFSYDKYASVSGQFPSSVSVPFLAAHHTQHAASSERPRLTRSDAKPHTRPAGGGGPPTLGDLTHPPP